MYEAYVVWQLAMLINWRTNQLLLHAYTCKNNLGAVTPRYLFINYYSIYASACFCFIELELLDKFFLNKIV